MRAFLLACSRTLSSVLNKEVFAPYICYPLKQLLVIPAGIGLGLFLQQVLPTLFAQGVIAIGMENVVMGWRAISIVGGGTLLAIFCVCAWQEKNLGLITLLILYGLVYAGALFVFH